MLAKMPYIAKFSKTNVVFAIIFVIFVFTAYFICDMCWGRNPWTN